MVSLCRYLAFAFVVFVFETSAGGLEYPKTKKVEQKDNYFGTIVSDPYRWLEDDTSSAVAQWVQEENKVTFAYLDKIPFRRKILERLEQIFNYRRYSTPSHKGEYYIFSKNDGLQNQSVYYVQKGLNGIPEVLIDPNKLSRDGTVRLSSLALSRDGKYFAYGISRSGSDWNEIFVVETRTRKQLPDHIRWLKNAGADWFGEGFFYSGYDAPKDTAKLFSAKNVNQKVFYHTLGADQGQDQLVYEDPSNPLRFAGVGVTEDERFQILYVTDPGKGNRGNALYVRDVSKGERSFQPIVTTFGDDFSVIEDQGDKLLIQTNKDAPNSKVILVDPDHPEESHWKTILPEEDEPMEFVRTIGGKLIVGYLKDVTTRVSVFDSAGVFEREIALPTKGVANGFTGEKQDSMVFYSFTSFTFPPTIYRYDLKTSTSTVFRTSEVKFSPNDYETNQVFYTSKDGTRVPMFLVYRKGIALYGNNPTLLYGYGGFDISMRPSFSSSLIALLEQGFVYALANIRGGGEYGEKWHDAGKKLNKQNVFDDFIAAAEWLIANKYTTPGRLALQGGSNGGLLVGVVMNQRPDLLKVALPAVGVMDMLRFQKFTIGWNWKADYGSSDDSTEFAYIYKYSPLHNIKEGLNYPATLATTADHDDRVVPAHSFKWIATLQEKYKGPNPVLIRIDTRTGHSASSLTKQLESTADVYAFMMYNLGVAPKY